MNKYSKIDHLIQILRYAGLKSIKETIETFNFTIVDLNDNCILHLTARSNRISVCEYLISLGIDINKQNYRLRTPLHESVMWNFEYFSEYLLKNGALINTQDDEGNTPLHIASQFGYLKMCNLLWIYGADPNIRNNTGKTFRDITSSEVIRSLGSGEKTKVCRVIQ